MGSLPSLKSVPLSGTVTNNIGTMFLDNCKRYGPKPAFAERVAGQYRFWTWEQLTQDIVKLAVFFRQQGLRHGDRIAFISRNSYHRLISEMAVLSSGLVCVPIFAGYPLEMMSQLLSFSKVSMLMSDNPAKIFAMKSEIIPPVLFVTKPTGAEVPETFSKPVLVMEEILRQEADATVTTEALEQIFRNVKPSDLAFIMYTSGTSTLPKGVQLTHACILSQQRALEVLWAMPSGLRFLCYLPWHHSFGGLFERFFVLNSGGCLAIDDSWGKNVDQLLKNFAEIKPHIYFSVPKIYQEIIARVLAARDVEQVFFHTDLKFVFTAAAPLPLTISDVFKNKGIPVVEGWGLTETSPCCTLTDMTLDRRPGVVGFPIPGVEIKLAEDNEIVVRGPNVMRGYFENPEGTQQVLDNEGWFKTGDIGEITDQGLKIVSRKDRMFKISNGEKVFPAPIEEGVRTVCKFIKYAYVLGKGLATPILLVFPNTELLAAKKGNVLDQSACVYPKCLKNLAGCLSQCIGNVNTQSQTKFERIQKALLIERELTIENNELTPSFKLVPRKIEENYSVYIKAMIEQRYRDLPPDAYVIDLPE